MRNYNISKVINLEIKKLKKKKKKKRKIPKPKRKILVQKIKPKKHSKWQRMISQLCEIEDS